MDTLLVAATALSLVMATGLSIVVGRLLRQERRRSEARAALLSEMAADAPPPPAAAAAPQAIGRMAKPTAATAERATIDDLDLRPAGLTVPGVAEMFTAPESASLTGRRIAVAAALTVSVLAVGFLMLSSYSRPATAVATATAPQPAASITPLELLSLRHAQQDSSLTITGLVQNPRGSGPLSGVVATVFLFGPDGGFLSSGRAPLDFTILGPGDESPFVVTVPVSGQVARYRVGFRSDEGAVISHIDKRGPDALASRQ